MVLGVGVKTPSNYTNHIAETPLDTAFEKAAWVKPTYPDDDLRSMSGKNE